MFKFLLFRSIVSIGLFFAINFNYAQEATDIVRNYNEYIKNTREISYLHINKSTFIKGEEMGFMAYVLNKKNQTPSQLSSNLYIVIEDKDKNVINSQMIRLNKGKASNTISIDSSFTSGYYTIKAFTNWMRNFKEQDYFVESFRVIDPKIEEYTESSTIKNEFDVQFLPESGHLLNNVENTLGVIIKDINGYGVPNVIGKVYDENRVQITDFKVNHLGIGRFKLIPEIGKRYFVEVSFRGTNFEYQIKNKIESFGIILSTTENNNKLYVTIKTNKTTLKSIRKNYYQLILHNQRGITSFKINFKDSNVINKVFDLTQIPSGVNTITLFDYNNNPISERLFFNYHNLLKQSLTDVIASEVKKDSIKLTFKLNNINNDSNHSLSVSILPKDTQSYNRNNDIISYNLLRPYLSGKIENGVYYFKNINRKTKYELDNLLLTQGWSSFKWNEIFKSKVIKYKTENGITINANINTKNTKKIEAYMVQLTDNKKPLIVKHSEKKSFQINNVFPYKNQDIYISEVRKNGNLTVPQLYLQSYPNSIPTIERQYSILKPKQKYLYHINSNGNELKLKLNGDEYQLDEVLVKAKVERNKIKLREQELSTGFGDVNVVTKQDRQSYFAIEDYIMSRGGIRVLQGRTSITFNTGRTFSPNSAVNMDIFIDDVYFGQSIPPRFVLMNNVDYIEINKTGLGAAQGQGFRGTGGVIRVYTNPKEIDNSFSNKIKAQKFVLPLAFSANKEYYVPKYKYQTDDFFKAYGVIDWKPNIRPNTKGEVNISIQKPKVPITLFIEGVSIDGSFISDKKTISFN